MSSISVHMSAIKFGLEAPCFCDIADTPLKTFRVILTCLDMVRLDIRSTSPPPTINLPYKHVELPRSRPSTAPACFLTNFYERCLLRCFAEAELVPISSLLLLTTDTSLFDVLTYPATFEQAFFSTT
jgi:hypothetical protein